MPPMPRWLSGLLATVVLVAAVSGLLVLVEPHAPALSLSVLYLLAVVPVAIVWGVRQAMVASLLSTTAFAYLFLPRGSLAVDDSRSLLVLLALLLTSVVVGELAARLRRRARASARLAEEQAALRRVATLVAQSTAPGEVFEAVTREVGQRSGADLARMERYEADGTVTGVARWSREDDPLAVGTRIPLEGTSIAALVRRTGRPVRVDSFSQASGPIAEEARTLGIRSSVGCPIVVGGRLWGVIAASSKRESPFPPDTESQMADFTKLVATAIENAEGRAEIARLAQEQAALRRVATLVARAVPPAQLFAAVTEEVAQLLELDLTILVRLEPDGTVTVLGGKGWQDLDPPLDDKWLLDPAGAVGSVLGTGSAARVDGLGDASGKLHDTFRRQGVPSQVASPITVEGRLWGTLGVGSLRGPLPADTEQRLVDFTELIATAIANAESRSALAASRARVVATADETRRRIERDLHDGIQQRLVSLGLELRMAQSEVASVAPESSQELSRIAEDLKGAIDDLREMSRGIHPAVLSEGGLGPALRTLARRSAVPVDLELGAEDRLPAPVEVAAYYVISEALTNTVKHARASHARVVVQQRDGVLSLSVGDDGVGGAEPARGSGLIGLRDRVEALGGSIQVTSHSGKGTVIAVELPLRPA
jgi:signal transduction histidine kinase